MSIHDVRRAYALAHADTRFAAGAEPPMPPAPTDTVTLTPDGYAALVEHYRAALTALAALTRYEAAPHAADGHAIDRQGRWVEWDDVAMILDKAGVPADA